MKLARAPFDCVRRTRRRAPRAGFALVVVLLVLLALLALATPFLMSASNADQASSQASDRSSSRVGLDAAARHARAVLSDTYPSVELDRTPYHDDLEELRVVNRFDATFLDPNDPNGAMWDVEVSDLAGRIDLNSAPPQVFANLTGLALRTTAVVANDAKTIPLSGAASLAPTGFVWIGSELVHYTALENGALTKFTRGTLGPAESKDWRGGPGPAASHGAGVPVIDQRAFAPCLWRTKSDDGELRSFEALEELPQGVQFALAAASGVGGNDLYGEALLRPLRAFGAVHAGVTAGPRWQRAVRITQDVEAGVDGRLRVDSARWINPGTTVRISDGASSELALVTSVLEGGEIALDRTLVNAYTAYEAQLEVLARRPVNANTAPRAVLVALFQNVQMVGRNSRITDDEAHGLADLVIKSRPLTGFEDFLRRVILPAGGIEKFPGDAGPMPDELREGGFVEALDALAVYRNALNANDGGLLFSTLPLAFTSRDVYALETRSALNAESGVERYSLVREEVSAIVPQRELTRVWARQEDFDDALRLTLDAPWWATGPNSTSRYDAGAQPPSRLWAHMGTFEGQVYIPGISDPAPFADRESPPAAEHVFASRDDEAFAQLSPTRVWESDRLRGRVLHFDHETRDAEGRWLPDQLVSYPPDHATVQWTTAQSPLLRPLASSFWIKPRTVGDATLVEVAGPDADVDRVTLSIEGADLVLRVVDGVGDHRDTTEREAGELRYAIGAGTSPGLPADIWSHIAFDVRGNRPSQLHMLVNGLAHGVRTPGMTRLTSALSLQSSVLAVDSLEGFPAQCTVRVGNELIEVLNEGGALRAERQLTGRLAGFGGRIARERFSPLSESGQGDVPQSIGTIATVHPAGTPVELYGYSLPLASDVPTGRALLPSAIGPFRVAMAIGVVGGQTSLGDPIVTLTQAGPLNLGLGMRGVNSGVTGLTLRCADDDDTSPAIPPSEFMNAFDANGGYAAILSVAIGGLVDSENAAVGGVEVIRYSGYDGTTLRIAERAMTAAQLPNLAGGDARLFSGPRSFVTQWDANLTIGGVPLQTNLNWRTYVLPISLAVPGAGQVNGFLNAIRENSAFAQITHVDDAELTEWVRYDHFDAARGQLVRDDFAALENVYRCVIGARVIDDDDLDPPGGGGGGGGMIAPPSFALAPDTAPPSSTSSTSSSTSSASSAQGGGGTNWDPRVGENENESATYPITRAIETIFQFRGVFGTFSHAHPANTPVLPVWRTRHAGFEAGRPGRMDAAFLVGANPDHPGWPVRVHRSFIPNGQYVVTGWSQATPNATRPTELTATALAELDPNLRGFCYVALQDRAPEPMVARRLPDTTVDARRVERLTLFPSGELPRGVTRTTLGGGLNQAAVLPALLDEATFGDSRFAVVPTIDPIESAGAALIVDRDVDEEGTTIVVAPARVRVALHNLGSPQDFLPQLKQSGGLLRIGDELLAYSELDATTGTITVANGGRGLLGSQKQAHQVGEPVTYLEHHVVTTLSGGVGAADASLPLASAEDFPPEGLVLIGDELIQYTRVRGTTLEMPRASTEAGRRDGGGNGIFRGRYGTQPATHAAGTAVILFPQRYPDRWAARADAPELAYFGLSIVQPAAFWTGAFFVKEDTQSARIGVLQRARAATPWDADTDRERELSLFYVGDKDGKALPIGKQSDAIEWRVFVEYQSGAFDAKSGLPHGWKETPRLRLFSGTYFAPSVTLRSVER